MVKRRNAPAEAVSGRYAPIPHSLLDSCAFQACGHMAKALLFELVRQHNGSDNGHLRLSRTWLAARGWKCVASIASARDELLRNRLIVQTRHGGLRNGSHCYALTWLAVTNYAGLDIGPQDYYPGAYLLPPKQNGRLSDSPRNAAAGLPDSPSDSAPRLPHSPETALSEASPGLNGRHKLSKPLPTACCDVRLQAWNRRAARTAPRDWRH
ncbi:hypothetical protein GALL_231830 [mine drainage metagenome]|uniref:Uncharacterized protein n=1 Tax=mine drainage metagenome TaxID=410659 RepID=A0A1J5RRX0_9ZZZZ